jgi:hypothetical protein
VTSDVGEEQLQAVGRSDDRLGIDLRRLDLGRLLLLGCGGRASLRDLETDGLELTLKLGDFLLAEIVLERKRLQLHGLDEAALLGGLHHRAGALVLEQFVQMLVRQRRLSVLSSP